MQTEMLDYCNVSVQTDLLVQYDMLDQTEKLRKYILMIYLCTLCYK